MEVVKVYRGVPAATSAAFAELCLLPSAPAELVRSAHRLLAKKAHPDVGGSHRKMLALNLGFEQALMFAEQHDASAGRTGAA